MLYCEEPQKGKRKKACSNGCLSESVSWTNVPESFSCCPATAKKSRNKVDAVVAGLTSKTVLHRALEVPDDEFKAVELAFIILNFNEAYDGNGSSKASRPT